jgi:hypothetical protein
MIVSRVIQPFAQMHFEEAECIRAKPYTPEILLLTFWKRHRGMQTVVSWGRRVGPLGRRRCRGKGHVMRWAIRIRHQGRNSPNKVWLH